VAYGACTLRSYNERRLIHGCALFDDELIELASDEKALAFLEKVYRNPRQPIERRIRCAVRALPYENPKLSAVALASMDAHSFAKQLDLAIQRSDRANRSGREDCYDQLPER
jgi:hypothetical protein